MKYCCDFFKEVVKKGDLYTENGFLTMDDDKISKYFFRSNSMWGVVEDYLEKEPMTDKILCMQTGLNGILFSSCPFCDEKLKSGQIE